jgi:hypothetical protein
MVSAGRRWDSRGHTLAERGRTRWQYNERSRQQPLLHLEHDPALFPL